MGKTLLKILAVGVPVLGAIATTSLDINSADAIAPIIAKTYMAVCWAGLGMLTYDDVKEAERRESYNP